jgi:hypothetical protein
LQKQPEKDPKALKVIKVHPAYEGKEELWDRLVLQVQQEFKVQMALMEQTELRGLMVLRVLWGKSVIGVYQALMVLQV